MGIIRMDRTTSGDSSAMKQARLAKCACRSVDESRGPDFLSVEIVTVGMPAGMSTRAMRFGACSVAWLCQELQEWIYERVATGQRRGEIAALQFSWINENEKTITLPATITKNGRQHAFLLGSLVMVILNPLRDKRSYLLPKSKAVLDKTSGVTDWTLHDLRRTFATIHARIGTLVHVTERLLNHVSCTHAGIVGVYQRHTYLHEMAAAMTNHETKLSKILGIETPGIAA